MILGDTLIITPYPDDRGVLAHEVRSPYVETFWLPIIGPSTYLFLRRCATLFDTYPQGCEIDTAQTASALGIAPAVLGKSIDRALMFHTAHLSTWGLHVRQSLSSLGEKHLARLHPDIAATHDQWLDSLAVTR